MDEPALLALRHVGLATALHIIKIFNATQPLEPATADVLHQRLSAEEWDAMRSSLLAALQVRTRWVTGVREGGVWVR